MYKRRKNSKRTKTIKFQIFYPPPPSLKKKVIKKLFRKKITQQLVALKYNNDQQGLKNEINNDQKIQR